MWDWSDRIFSSDTSEAEALDLVRKAYARDPRCDSHLLDRGRERPTLLPLVLRLLSAVSNGQRLVATLLPLMHSADPEIREPAALLIARGRTNLGWAREMLDDPDPRVRANVVEGISFWSRDIHLLNRALKDTHHRVVCNAIVAMYPIKPARARVLLEHHLRSRDWLFRAAATWACGAIGDASLATLVQRMRNDPHPSVRWNALRATTAIHKANAPRKRGTASAA